MHRTSFAFVVSSLVALAAVPARADDAATAARLYKEGWRLYEDKQYEEACPLLERSVEAAPTIKTRGALALCWEAAGKNAAAYRAWQAVADAASAAGPAEAQRGKRAAQKVEQLRAKVTMVRLTMEGNPAETQVKLDGRTLAASELAAAIPLDVGKHALEARAAERNDWRSGFELAASDAGQTRSIQVGPLAPIEAIRPDVTTPTGPTGTGPVAPAVVDTGPMRRSPTWRWVGLGVAGAGVVAIGVGVVFGLSASSKWSDAKDAGCNDDGVCPNRAAADLVDDARSKGTLSTVMTAAGVGLAAGGVLLYLFAPKERVSVTPGVSAAPGGASITIGGTF